MLQIAQEELQELEVIPVHEVTQDRQILVEDIQVLAATKDLEVIRGQLTL